MWVVYHVCQFIASPIRKNNGGVKLSQMQALRAILQTSSLGHVCVRARVGQQPVVTDSMKRFVCSVWRQIEPSCVLEPTERQEKVLGNFGRFHCHRQNDDQWAECLVKQKRAGNIPSPFAISQKLLKVKNYFLGFVSAPRPFAKRSEWEPVGITILADDCLPVSLQAPSTKIGVVAFADDITFASIHIRRVNEP